MTAHKKKSSLITIISICLFILLISSSIYTTYLTNSIESDAQIINELGIIKGSIQRLVKLELHNKKNNNLLNSLDSTIDDFQMENIKIYGNNNEVRNFFIELKQEWVQLKQLIHIYRVNPSDYNEKMLIQKSEEIWDKDNNTMFISHVASKRKVDSYKNGFLSFSLNLTLVIFIIFSIQKYVRYSLEYFANHDTLTKGYNRNYFNEFLKSQIKISERYNKDLSLLLFDVDHLKKINDKYGHYTGDYVLKELSNNILQNIRKSDVFARIAGQKFAIILPEASIDNAMVVSEKLRKIISNYNFNPIGNITISAGISQFSNGDTPDMLYNRADIALYKAKNNGRNRSEIEIKDESFSLSKT